MSASIAQIASSFSRAATSYDAAAALQRDVGEQLWQLYHSAVHGRVAANNCVADIGCGTGFMTHKLQTTSAQVFAVDIAPGMLQAVQTQQWPNVAAMQADMAQLPFVTHNIDMLLSSLALQWANSLPDTFAEWRRVLRPGGTLAFSTFLPGTLHELQSSWRAVDDAEHVNRFVAQPVLLEALHAAGFAVARSELHTHVRHYDSVQSLSRELKAIGAHNMNAGRLRGLAGRQRWQRLQAAYDRQRNAQGLPASYEVLCVIAH